MMARPRKADQKKAANSATLGFEEKLWQVADKLRPLCARMSETVPPPEITVEGETG